MAIKDNFVGLFIKRFIIPGALVFNKPGFVDFKISGKTNIFARQIFYPEEFFSNFESKMVSKFGDDGRQILYSIGKKFGYRFAQSGKFENINDHPGDKIKEWIFIASKFVEGTYASSIENVTDVNLKKTDFFLKKFTVLEELGFEYIFATGGTAGLMAWIFQDKNIEVVMNNIKKVDGLYEATVTSAPADYLKLNFPDNKLLEESDLDNLGEDYEGYVRFNAQAETSCKKSFQTYLDFKLFKYEKGIVSFNDQRLFLFEISGTYLLELELKKKGKKYLDLLFNSAFETGEKVMALFGKGSAEIFDVLSAIGWGEVLQFASSADGKKILVNHFPWSRWYNDIDFLIMRGFLSGISSKIDGKKIVFEKPIVDLSKGHLSLLFSGKYV